MEKHHQIEKYLEGKIKNSLYHKTQNSFTNALVEKIELEQRFVKEDKKADNVFKTLVLSIITVLTFVTGLVVYDIFRSGGDESSGNVFTDAITDFYTNFGFRVADMIGLNFDSNMLIFIPVLALFLIIFSIAEKKLFRNSS